MVTFAGFYSLCGNEDNDPDLNGDTYVDQDLTPDLSLITAAMTSRSNSVWNGMTMIKEGIHEARHVLKGPAARPLAEKIMIVLTDGAYNGGDPVPEAANTYNSHDITVHTITFGAGANQTDMQAVAVAGHGRHFHAPDPETLSDIFHELAGTISILTE